MIRVGLIGYGYWGPNVLRNFRGVDGCEVATVCDRSPSALKRVAQAYPDIDVVSDPAEIMLSPKIDAVAVVTPVHTHFELAKAALLNGKHVFSEKPFTASMRQAEELIEIAASRNLKIMVDHTFLFTPSGNFTVHPFQYDKLPYTNADLVPIARVSNTILGVGVPTAMNVGTIADWVARAKAEPRISSLPEK